MYCFDRVRCALLPQTAGRPGCPRLRVLHRVSLLCWSVGRSSLSAVYMKVNASGHRLLLT